VWSVGMKKISGEAGHAALEAWRQGSATENDVATATRFCLQRLRESAPGRSVELRVPPCGAAQIIEGPSHTRGTPPAVIEMSPQTWLSIATGLITYSDAVEAGVISASGQRTDLTAWLPIAGLAWPA
jgi:hypothetical protein